MGNFLSLFLWPKMLSFIKHLASRYILALPPTPHLSAGA